MSNNNLTSKSVGLLQSLPQTHYAYASGFLLTGEIIGERKRVSMTFPAVVEAWSRCGTPFSSLNMTPACDTSNPSMEVVMNTTSPSTIKSLTSRDETAVLGI